MQRTPQALELRGAEAAADAAGEAQRTGLRVHPEQECAEARAARAPAGRPAADEELLATDVLDLDPRARAPSGLIRRVPALGDDSLETLIGARAQDRLAVSGEVLGSAPVLAVELQRAESLAPLGVGEA